MISLPASLTYWVILNLSLIEHRLIFNHCPSSSLPSLSFLVLLIVAYLPHCPRIHVNDRLVIVPRLPVIDFLLLVVLVDIPRATYYFSRHSNWLCIMSLRLYSNWLLHNSSLPLIFLLVVPSRRPRHSPLIIVLPSSEARPSALNQRPSSSSHRNSCCRCHRRTKIYVI